MILGLCRGLPRQAIPVRSCAALVRTAWPVNERAAWMSLERGEKRFYCEAKTEEPKKKGKKKAKKPKTQEAEVSQKTAAKPTPKQSIMTHEEHKAVTNDYIAEQLKKKIEHRQSESWLRRFSRKVLIRKYAEKGGPAHEYMREHGLTDPVEHMHQMLRVLHVYGPIAHEAVGGKDPRTMSNEEFIETKQNTLTRMLASQQFHRVFPDVMDKFTPKINLVVGYDTEEIGTIPVIRGNEVPPTLAKGVPTVRFAGLEGHTYTLLMVDPDAPSAIDPHLGQFLHWLVGNVPSNGDVSAGQTVAQYLGPGPPKGTDYHRYVYVLLDEGASKADYSNEPRVAENSLDGRPKFDTRSFIERHNLRPVGIVFFNASYDAYVAELYGSLGLDEPIFVDERTHRVMTRKDTKYESGRFKAWKVLEKEE